SVDVANVNCSTRCGNFVVVESAEDAFGTRRYGNCNQPFSAAANPKLSSTLQALLRASTDRAYSMASAPALTSEARAAAERSRCNPRSKIGRGRGRLPSLFLHRTRVFPLRLLRRRDCRRNRRRDSLREADRRLRLVVELRSPGLDDQFTSSHPS